MALKFNRRPPTKPQALEFFLSSLRDPHNPRHCGLCLDGAFLQCTGAPQWDISYCEPQYTIPTQTQHNPELWNAIVKFLFIRRSRKQLDELLTRLSECSCRLDQESEDMQQYHEISKTSRQTSNMRTYNLLSIQDQPDETKGFAVSWNSFLANLFLALSVVIGRSHMTSSAKGVAPFWPIRLTDLIPFGAEDFVQSMLLWHSTFQDPIIFRVTGAVLRVSGDLVTPSLINSRFTALVVESARRSIARVLREHLAILNSKPAPTYVLSIFPWQAVDTVYYLKAVLNGMSDDDLSKARSFLDCETRAMQLCSILLYMIEVMRRYKDPPDFSPYPDEFAETGQELYRYFSLHTPSRPPFPVHPLIQELDVERFPPPDLSSTLRMRVLAALRRFRLDTKCSVLGCPNSLHIVGKAFQRCGKCRLVPYCGRECQKKAWKDPRYPHKVICPILQDLIEKAGGHTLFFSATREAHDQNVPSTLSKIIYCWLAVPIDPNDLNLISEWETSLRTSRGYHWPLEEEDLSPGYTDYEECITVLSELLRGMEPVYLEPLGRWPEEVARQLQTLMLQPFWGQEIDF